jgi:hypothetical protein
MSQVTRQGRYLNVILTVNAVLLAGIVWVQLVGVGALATIAHAQKAPDTGIPNAASQRQRIIEELQAMRTSVDAMRKTVEGGKMKVVVDNIGDIKVTAEDGKGK